MHLVFSAFPAIPTSLLATNIAPVLFLYIVCVFAQEIRIVGIDRELVCPFQFQSVLVYT